MLTERSRAALEAAARLAREHFPRSVPDERVVGGLVAAWQEHAGLGAEQLDAAAELARGVLQKMRPGDPILGRPR